MSAIRPGWKCPREVRSLITTRNTGNLATHVGDIDDVFSNRERLVKAYSLPQQPVWLDQQHGNEVYIAHQGPSPTTPPKADAAFTREFNRPLAVLVADCLPVFLASPDEVAVIHAGWRGLASGVIGRTIARFRNREITAWLGPSIGPCHYEVDDAVRSSFDGVVGFSKGRDGDHYMMDLPVIARHQLRQADVHQVEGGAICTWCDPQFWSHRQAGQVSNPTQEGRFAAIIWREGGIF